MQIQTSTHLQSHSPLPIGRNLALFRANSTLPPSLVRFRPISAVAAPPLVKNRRTHSAPPLVKNRRTHLMYDGQDPKLFDHFSAVAQRLDIYTANDYADILEVLVQRWSLEKVEQGLTGEGRQAQDFVCNLAPRIRKLHEQADQRAKKLKPYGVNFSWIFNKEIPILS